MATTPVTRFAPSPTGPLHLGHAWSALQAHDLARAGGGRFLLRIEDIDKGRCREEHVAGIVRDLQWLGLCPDAPPLFQSHRLALYADALDRLAAQRLIYRCVCTRSDIAAAASAPQGPMGLLYPGTCRDRAIGADVAQPWCWRLDTGRAEALAGPLFWEDRDVGRVAARPGELGDVVIARKDAPASYHLAVVIDDGAQGITHVVRGRDLFAATHIQRLLQAVLGLATPAYVHHRLIVDATGERLAKRRQAPSLAALRSDGADPVRLVENMRACRFPAGFSLEAS
jgi:glutamyl-Q tRNA(Asp) synthetase